jgi:hypothetical protein
MCPIAIRRNLGSHPFLNLNLSLTPSSVYDINRSVVEYCKCCKFFTDSGNSFKGDFMDFFFLFKSINTAASAAPQIPLYSEDAGIEPRTLATLLLTARRSNHSAKSHPVVGCSPDCMKNSEFGSVTSLTIWRIFSYAHPMFLSG